MERERVVEEWEALMWWQLAVVKDWGGVGCAWRSFNEGLWWLFGEGGGEEKV